MYCRKCGSQNDDNTYKCVHCGEVLQQVKGSGMVPQQIPNYLVQAILVTVLCCLPLGIPAIIFASQVNGKIIAGDIDGAITASNKAKMWCWWSFGIGLPSTIIWGIISFLAELAKG